MQDMTFTTEWIIIFCHHPQFECSILMPWWVINGNDTTSSRLTIGDTTFACTLLLKRPGIRQLLDGDAGRKQSSGAGVADLFEVLSDHRRIVALYLALCIPWVYYW